MALADGDVLGHVTVVVAQGVQGAVLLVIWVEVATGRSASIRVVPELMDMEAVRTRIATSNIIIDGGGRMLILLSKCHSASNIGITPKYGNCIWMLVC